MIGNIASCVRTISRHLFRILCAICVNQHTGENATDSPANKEMVIENVDKTMINSHYDDETDRQ